MQYTGLGYYKNSASYNGSNLGGQSSASSVYQTQYDTDDGVFMTDGYNSLEHGTISTATPMRARYKSSANKDSFGSTNMSTSSAYGMCIRKIRGGQIGSKKASQIQISITKGTTATNSSIVYTNDEIWVYSDGVARVDKVDFVEKISYTETGIGPRNGEIVYASGWTVFSFKSDGTIYDKQSIILARCTSSEKPTLLYGGGNIPRCENSSLVFSDDGSKLYALIGNNGTPLSSKVSTSIPDDAVVSNNGLLAVSCMTSLDGQAAWLGYKNGIYKIYQGPKPLYGMPGERMTIKGHEFVCLAYGPFYARLS